MQDTRIDNCTAADRLITAHDGDVALLYIYIHRTGCRDLEQAARDLCRTMQELRAAEEKLQRMGLLDTAPGAERPAPAVPSSPAELRVLPPAEEMPQYTAQEIAALAAESTGFAEIQHEAAQVKGRQLSTSELGILAGIYRYLSLPTEVVLMLLNYCRDTAEARHPGSRPSIRMIQQEAFHWANLEILTLDQANAYIARQSERRSVVGRVQELLGLQGRNLTAPERRHIDAWLDMGFSPDGIQLAYERTVYRTGQLKWPYMDTILKNWHSAGLHDREAIEGKDPPRRSGKTPAAQAQAPEVDLKELKEILERI